MIGKLGTHINGVPGSYGEEGGEALGALLQVQPQAEKRCKENLTKTFFSVKQIFLFNFLSDTGGSGWWLRSDFLYLFTKFLSLLK